MRKIIVLVSVLFFSLSAYSQLKISISEISLKYNTAETYIYYDQELIVHRKYPYIKIEVGVYNESDESFNIKATRRQDVFEMEYQYDGISNISKCTIQNPIYKLDGILSVPPKSSLKLYLVTSHEGLQSENYISEFIKVFPTITVRFTDEDKNKLLESSEPIKFQSLSVKSAAPEE
jgi:hypothetical protein